METEQDRPEESCQRPTAAFRIQRNECTNIRGVVAHAPTKNQRRLFEVGSGQLTQCQGRDRFHSELRAFSS
jgi:hypothetical protein